MIERPAAVKLRQTLTLSRLALASVVVNVLIVVTGGAVRLSGSGLGCPTFPSCGDGSLTPRKAFGAHGIIEFTNRQLTFVVVLAVNVDVFFVFHVIVEVSFNGFVFFAKPARSIGSVLSEPLKTPLLTPPPTQPETGRLITIVWTFFTLEMPGVTVIFPDGGLHFVPPAALAGPALSTPTGISIASAMVKRTNDFMV